jgi:hypothetical protein
MGIFSTQTIQDAGLSAPQDITHQDVGLSSCTQLEEKRSLFIKLEQTGFSPLSLASYNALCAISSKSFSDGVAKSVATVAPRRFPLPELSFDRDPHSCDLKLLVITSVLVFHSADRNETHHRGGERAARAGEARQRPNLNVLLSCWLDLFCRRSEMGRGSVSPILGHASSPWTVQKRVRHEDEMIRPASNDLKPVRVAPLAFMVVYDAAIAAARLSPLRQLSPEPDRMNRLEGWSAMQTLIKERIAKLREEIAQINEANRLYVQGRHRLPTAASDHARRLQRLQEIRDELLSLTDWKKL